MEASTRPRPARAAFTLVELLTVVVIIGILAALISAVVVGAVRKAKMARVTLEINLLDTSLKAYKEKYGDYPPDNMSNTPLGRAAVEAHLRRAFPNYRPTGTKTLYQQFHDDVEEATREAFKYASNKPATGLDISQLSPASAMVFWLGGLPVPVPKGYPVLWLPDGFAQDVEMPFVTRGQTVVRGTSLGQPVGLQRSDPVMDFDHTRILFAMQGSVILNVLHYYPNFSGAQEANCPYVYFRASNRGYEHALTAPLSEWFVRPEMGMDGSGNDVLQTVRVLPYLDGRRSPPVWANLNSFQIICAGPDNLYGATEDDSSIPGWSPPTFPTGNYLGTTGHYDNLTNFAEGKLEDATQ